MKILGKLHYVIYGCSLIYVNTIYIKSYFLHLRYGTQSVAVKAFIPSIVTLLGDPTAQVRDAAFQTLIEIYKHVGDRLRIDLKKKEVPAAKLAILEQKFDEVRNEGLLMPSATNTVISVYDEADAAPPARPTKLVKRTPSAVGGRKPGLYEILGSGSGDNMSVAGQAGAVSAEVFESSFENVPQLTIYAARDIDDHMKNINVIIGDKNMHWEKRVDAVSFSFLLPEN